MYIYYTIFIYTNLISYTNLIIFIYTNLISYTNLIIYMIMSHRVLCHIYKLKRTDTDYQFLSTQITLKRGCTV